jgi:penicillin amidase
MPQVLNPSEGFVATANNRIISESYPYYLSNLWEPEWRIERITEVLRSKPILSVEDMQRLQQDVVSPQAREVVPIILRAFEGQPPPNSDVQTALTYFRNWNYEMKVSDVATSLFEAFLVRMIHNTFEDEMGPSLLAIYDTLPGVPLNAITKLMKKGSSSWFDNVNTPQIETMNDIIRQSLDDALHDLKTKYGGEIKEWRWGPIHQVQFPHVFSANDILRPIFTVGPFPVGGSHSTVNNGEFGISNPYLDIVGPSTRQIFDLADINDTRSITPPGQSGQVFQRHYDDQVHMWLNGLYRRQTMDRASIEKAGYDLLILRPSK